MKMMPTRTMERFERRNAPLRILSANDSAHVLIARPAIIGTMMKMVRVVITSTKSTCSTMAPGRMRVRVAGVVKMARTLKKNMMLIASEMLPFENSASFGPIVDPGAQATMRMPAATAASMGRRRTMRIAATGMRRRFIRKAVPIRRRWWSGSTIRRVVSASPMENIVRTRKR